VPFFCRVDIPAVGLLLPLVCGVMIEKVAFNELSFLLFTSESVTVVALALGFTGVAVTVARVAFAVGLPTGVVSNFSIGRGRRS